MDPRDQKQYAEMNKNRPDTDPSMFRMQDGGLYSVATVYKSQCRNLAESLVVDGVVLTGHQLRAYLQAQKPGTLSRHRRDN